VTTDTKILLGIGGLAAVGIGGAYLYSHQFAKAVDKGDFEAAEGVAKTAFQQHKFVTVAVPVGILLLLVIGLISSVETGGPSIPPSLPGYL